MRSVFTLALTGAILCLSQRALPAAQILCSGVLGNSGEQGRTLVRFGDTPARGMGVVADDVGSLWDRAGGGVLNRYARDGRLLATYKIPAGGNADRITRVGNLVVLLINGRLYSLPINAASNTTVESLDIAASMMSFNSINGSLAIATTEDKANYTLSLYNPANHQNTLLMDAEVTGSPNDVELLADGSLMASINSKLHYYSKGKEVLDGWPKNGLGERLQYIDGFWYGSAWHGTLRRFNDALEPDPGVVLGGGSGSFIGHVDGNTEVENPRGLTKITSELFAVSGLNGILHLLQWDKNQKQFSIIRRIGAVPYCDGLAINRQGQVLFYNGHWDWKDDPCAPLRDCGGGAPMQKGQMGQPVIFPNDNFIVPARNLGAPYIVGGPFSWKVIGNFIYGWPPKPEDKDKPSYQNGSAVYTDDQKHLILLAIDATGKGESYRVDPSGRMNGVDGPVTLKTGTPVKAWTSLAMKSNEVLIGAADGFIIEMTRNGVNWQEARRWNSWKGVAPCTFGKQIYITADAGRLWVSDTEHHRVLCFSQVNDTLLATFGTADKPGDALGLLNAPQAIAAREKRAVVFDSANQRLLKLIFAE